MLKHLLVHVDSSESCSKRIEIAADLAACHGARLTGLQVTPWTSLYVSVAAQVPPALVEKNQQCAKEEAERLKKLFLDHTAASSTKTQWIATEGDVARQLVEHAAFTDLLILGRDRLVSGVVSSDSYFDTIPMTCGRPVLCVPNNTDIQPIGERIVVAWDASCQAARALQDAMPLLQQAKTATVITAAPPGTYTSQDAENSLLQLAPFLESHGVHASTEILPCRQSETGLTILAAAHDAKADLLVMGAYGRSRFTQLVLGGTTRYAMQNMTIPTLVSH